MAVDALLSPCDITQLLGAPGGNDVMIIADTLSQLQADIAWGGPRPPSASLCEGEGDGMMGWTSAAAAPSAGRVAAALYAGSHRTGRCCRGCGAAMRAHGKARFPEGGTMEFANDHETTTYTM